MLFSCALKRIRYFVITKCNRLEYDMPSAFADSVCQAVSREVRLPANEEVKIKCSVDNVGRDIIQILSPFSNSEFSLDWDMNSFRRPEANIYVQFLILGGCDYSLGAWYAALITQQSERLLFDIGGPRYYLGNRFERVVFVDAPED